MAEAASRTRRQARVIFLFLFIFMLPCLAYINRDQLFQDILRAIKESERQKAEDQHRNATITKLFDLSASLTDKENLRIFKEALQAAVEEEERLKVEQKHRMVTVRNEIEQRMRHLIHLMEQAKLFSANSPELQGIVYIVTNLMNSAREYYNKKLALLKIRELRNWDK